MSKRKTNLKRIQKKFMSSNWNKFVIAICVIGIFLTYAFFGRGFYTGLLTAIILTLVLFLIGWIIAYVMSKGKVNALKNVIVRQGDLESFEQEDFKEIAKSKAFYVGDEWLLWNQGKHYRVFNKDEIEDVVPLEGQREGNAFGQCGLVLKKLDKPMMLTYAVAPGNDCVNALRMWKKGYYNPNKKICPHCLGPNELNQTNCTYCGRPL